MTMKLLENFDKISHNIFCLLNFVSRDLVTVPCVSFSKKSRDRVQDFRDILDLSIKEYSSELTGLREAPAKWSPDNSDIHTETRNFLKGVKYFQTHSSTYKYNKWTSSYQL